MFGRWGVPEFFKKIIKRWGLKPENMDRVRVYFDANPRKTISLSKITLGIGIAGIYLAGHAKIPYSRFIRICLITSALQYVIYLGIGLLFGSAYKQISQYLDFFAAFSIVTGVSILLFFIVKSYRRKLLIFFSFQAAIILISTVCIILYAASGRFCRKRVIK